MADSDMHSTSKNMLRNSTDYIRIFATQILFVKSPVRSNFTYSVRVTPLSRLNEMHFLIFAGEGADEPAMIKGHESEICFQVMRSFSKLCIRKEIKGVFFYSNYDGGYKKIQFTDFNTEIKDKSWPKFDSGLSLTGKKITSIRFSGTSPSKLTDDYKSPAICYWNQAAETAQVIDEDYFNEIQELIDKNSSFEKRIGDLSIQVFNSLGIRVLFALDKDVLASRIADFKSEGNFLATSEIFAAASGIGWACYGVRIDSTRQSLEVIEPGTYQLNQWRWEEYLSKIPQFGGTVVEISQNMVIAELSTEIDMTKPDGGTCLLLKRGVYNLELVIDDDDGPPF